MTLEGRVLRLHFACRASLPIGSTLRVTGSSLWAPGALTNQMDDPTDSHRVSLATRSDGFSDGASHDLRGNNLYASSVEMVTSPEEYPVWKTKTPVVVVLTGQREVWHHRYRSLVVTPGVFIGGGGSGGGFEEGDETGDDEEGFAVMEVDGTMAGSTSNDMGGGFPVMKWEDPFKHQLVSTERSLSSTSLPSLVKAQAIKTLSNLPYRTLDIDLTNLQGEEGREEGVEYNKDGVRVDQWNNGEDLSFRAFSDRMEQVRQTGMMETDSLSSNSFMSDNDEPTTTDSNLSLNNPTTPKKRLFLVCFHLPVKLSYDQTTGWSATWSESLLAKSTSGNLTRTHDTHWVGTVTVPSSVKPSPLTDSDRQGIIDILKPMGCTPLFLDEGVRAAHYGGMCKQVLWPAFHNVDLTELSNSSWGRKGDVDAPTEGRSVIESDWDQSRLDKWWEAYKSVNMAFGDALQEVLKVGDIMWVHDYHLSLLPRIISEREESLRGCRTSKIVFFLHIPFPTSQIFRELECGEAILNGMLHADVVGFHAFDHARHFLNAAKRILGLNYENLMGGLIGVQYYSRKVLITMSNVSIEPEECDQAMNAPSVAPAVEAMRLKHGDRKMIVGVDIAQRLSGISLKLLAYERLLTDYPIWKASTVMIQRCLIPDSRPGDEQSTILEIRFLVRRIQESFGTHVIDYQEVSGSSLPIDQRMVLWSVADVFMDSPVREGLNLLPLEYVYARKKPAEPGVTIASEFSAVSSILNGALRVNPFDIQLTASVLDKALTMDMLEREGRHARDIDFAISCNKDKWTKNVLRDLNEATMKLEDSDVVNQLSPNMEQVDSTAAFLAKESDLAFSHVDSESLIQAYKQAKRRVIITDFNGTLVIKEPHGKYLKREILGSSGLKPPSQVINALKNMVADPKNTVFVVSGDSQENVETALGNIDKLGLASANGATYALPTSEIAPIREWQYFDLGVNWDAVTKVAIPVLSKYTARTNGSFVKLTKASIGWSYYSCDPEWGSLQASHLVLELESELRGFDVRFVTLKGIVEIVPRRLNKGLIVTKVLNDVANKHDDLDFILCVGDDISDEKMFTSVFSFVAKMKKNDDPLYCYTLAVGKKATHASMYVDDTRDVANLFVGMTGGDTTTRRSMSWDALDTGAELFA